MSDILDLAPALAGWRLTWCIFLRRPVVDGPEGCCVRESGDLVPRQSAAANGNNSGWLLFGFAGTLVEARGVPLGISDRAGHRRELADTNTGGRADSYWKRRISIAP